MWLFYFIFLLFVRMRLCGKSFPKKLTHTGFHHFTLSESSFSKNSFYTTINKKLFELSKDKLLFMRLLIIFRLEKLFPHNTWLRDDVNRNFYPSAIRLEAWLKKWYLNKIWQQHNCCMHIACLRKHQHFFLVFRTQFFICVSSPLSTFLVIF